LPDPVREIRPDEEVLDQRLRLLFGERLEKDRGRIHLPSSPAGAGVEELGPRHAEEKDWGLSAPVGYVIEEIEKSRLRPVDVVDDQHYRATSGERLYEPSYGAEGVFARHDLFARQPDRRRDRVHEPSCLSIRCEHSTELGIRGDLLEDLDEWKVRDPVAVGETASPQDDRATLRLDELEDEARLADSGRPEHREELARAVAHRARVRLDQLLQLTTSADEGRVEPSLEARHVGSHAEQPVGEERLRLALRLDRLDTFELERALRELPRRVTDEDVTRLCGLLEPCCNVDGVTRCERAALARHDLAGIDTHANLQLCPELVPQVSVETAKLLAQLVRSACSTERIVLVHDGDTENRHDRVTDELLHRAAVPL